MLFERFISKERNEPPDIDVDFEHQRREEVMQYVYREVRPRPRGARRHAHHLPAEERGARRRQGARASTSRRSIGLTGVFAWWDGRAVDPARIREAGFDPDNPLIARLVALTGDLMGFPRHLSQHVGGFVIARGLLERMVPVENATMKDRTVIQWDKDDLDAMGLLKVDCLALGMLSRDPPRARHDLAVSRGSRCGCRTSRPRIRRSTRCASAPTRSACSRSSRARSSRCCRGSNPRASTTS